MFALVPASLLGLTLLAADPCSREALEKILFESREAADPAERLAQISSRFVGLPYQFSPLGEGYGVDPEPLCRLDRFDCLSLVEVSLALALASEADEAWTLLQRIRYLPPKAEKASAQPHPRWLRWLYPALGQRMDNLQQQSRLATYPRRKHFPLSQWLPLNQKEGFIEDITESVAGEQVKWMEKALDAKTWKNRKRPKYAPRLSLADIPAGEFRLPVLPIEKVLLLSERIPTGTIVAVVRTDRPDVFDPIVHVGIWVRKSHGAFLRHAAPKGKRQVVDEPIESFVRRSLSYRNWPVLGLNLQRVRARFIDPSPSQ
jgi:hypothetical protein